MLSSLEGYTCVACSQQLLINIAELKDLEWPQIKQEITHGWLQEFDVGPTGDEESVARKELVCGIHCRKFRLKVVEVSCLCLGNCGNSIQRGVLLTRGMLTSQRKLSKQPAFY